MPVLMHVLLRLAEESWADRCCQQALRAALTKEVRMLAVEGGLVETV